jgi:hypothetical protein
MVDGGRLQLLLVQKIINIQFFITQSNTDASIIESKREIHNSSKLIAPVCSRKQQQKFTFFGEMIYVIM